VSEQPGNAKPDDDPGFLPIIGALLLFAGAFGSALGITGFGSASDATLRGGIALSAVCGAVGGAILGRTSRVAGVVGGTLVSLGAFFAVLLYTGYVRTEVVWKLEIVLVASAGCVPGALVWVKLAPSSAPTDDRRQPRRHED